MEKLNKTIDENQCFYDDECIEFILDELTDANRSAMMRHTTTCEECKDFLDDYLEFDKSLTDVGQIKVSDFQLEEAVKSASAPKIAPSRKQESVDLVYTLTPWPLGKLLLVASDTGLCKISFVDDKTDPEELLSARYKQQFHLHRDDSSLAKAATELREYLAGKRHSFDLPLDMRFATTEFHREVLRGAMKIPFGQYTSYGELAERIGHPKAFRAVGSALGRNPIPIVVPCHRVMAGGGKLGGYTGGVHIKQKLMEIEGIHLSKQPSLSSLWTK
jgi:methylated-DNA-[protein]-cysteine S-methyltransferase